MIFPTDINLLAVLAAAIADMLIGAAWYSQYMFGSLWLAIMGKSKDELGGAGGAMAISTFASLVTAYVIAVVVSLTGASTIFQGFQVGLMLWFGFVVTTTLAGVLFEGSRWGLYFIYNGYQLLSFAAMGIILAVWR